MTLRLIVGLGNPGVQYENTRHNAGFIWADKLAKQLEINWLIKPNRYESSYQSIKIIKPQDYMNNSGIAVAKVMNFYKIKTSEVLVVYDDLDINPGLVRLKQAGGLGGHNGLKSIVQHVGSEKFYRLRIGIGRPPGSQSVSSFVLSKPNKIEDELMGQAIDRSLLNINKLFESRYAEFMQIVHTQNGDDL